MLTSAAAVLAAFGGVASAWSAAAKAQAGTQTAAAAPVYQVVRMGDGQLSCEELVTQVNTLTAEADAARSSAMAAAQASQQRAQNRAANAGVIKRAAFGGLASGMAYMPFGGGLASFAMRSAAVNAAGAAANGPQVIQVDTSAAAPAAEPPEAKRLAHLNGVLQRKGC